MSEITEDDIMEAFRERVAIMIHDGKVNETDAIRMAYFWAKQHFKVRVMPESAVKEMKSAINSKMGC